jgi:hypothetical protein
LEWGAPGKRRTLVWIRAGTIPAFALAAGFSLGLALAWTNGATGSALSPLWNILVGGPLLAIAGVLLFAFGTVESGSDSAEARPAGRRARLVLGMTPMQRYDFVMECALAFAGVASLTALALGGSRVRDENDAFAAILFGGGIGVLMFALVAPSVDLALGRGRLLALAPALAAVAPLLVGASIPTGDLFALFGASALFAFAWASAPQRYALTFDLSPSKGRLRAACDIQGTKLFVAALAPSIYLGSEKFLTGSGLIVASGFCVLALAIFAPTLGGLGRPQK